MDNQKANTRANLQKKRHKKQPENSIIFPIRSSNTNHKRVLKNPNNSNILKSKIHLAHPKKPVYINNQQPVNINLAIGWMFSLTIHHQNTITCISFLQRKIYTHPILQSVAWQGNQETFTVHSLKHFIIEWTIKNTMHSLKPFIIEWTIKN